MELKETLLMPKTDFPMRGNLPKREPQIEQKWYDEKIYQRVLDKNKDKTPFVLHDGPPYANGNIHMGHAMNKILKDFINSYYKYIGEEKEFLLTTIKPQDYIMPDKKCLKSYYGDITAILNKLTWFGALFLSLIAILPMLMRFTDIDISFGGTSILIVVGVALETVQQLESQLVMRHYKGFLEK